MSFQGKVAVVTGGALGIGQTLVKQFAKAGAKVAFIDHQAEAGRKTAQEINEAGGEALFYEGDIGHRFVLEVFANEVVSRFGGVHYVIHNAMTSHGGIHSDCSYDEFMETLAVGVAAPYYLTKLLLPHFREGAAIVNLSSTRAFQSQADTESYTAAKGGITALTHALAVSLAGKVRVNSVAPGWIDTGETYDSNYEPQHTWADVHQHPSRKVGHPMDIVRAVFFLCHEDNRFINGQNLTVDGGMSIRMIYAGDEGWQYSGDDGSHREI